jgi:hypothetical protein
VYTLRLSPALLDEFEVPVAGDDAPDASPTTRLGDWYVMPLPAGRRSLVLCSSSLSRLTIVMPRPDPPDLPEQLGVALVPVLRALHVPDDAIVAELDQMAAGRIGPTRSRALLAAMRGQARRAATFIAGAGTGQVDVEGLHRLLWSGRSTVRGHATIGELTTSLLLR